MHLPTNAADVVAVGVRRQLSNSALTPRIELAWWDATGYRHVGEVLAAMTPPLADGGVDAMLLDFGVSSMQIDSADRGFSFLADGPVDMRMDPQAALRAEEVRVSFNSFSLLPSYRLADVMRTQPSPFCIGMRAVQMRKLF